jgi:hypothetical protein
MRRSSSAASLASASSAAIASWIFASLVRQRDQCEVGRNVLKVAAGGDPIFAPATLLRCAPAFAPANNTPDQIPPLLLEPNVADAKPETLLIFDAGAIILEMARGGENLRESKWLGG